MTVHPSHILFLIGSLFLMAGTIASMFEVK